MQFEPVVKMVLQWIKDQTKSSIKHETELSRYRNRKAIEHKKIKEDTIGSARSTVNPGSIAFKIAVNYAGSHHQSSDPIIIYNLPA